MPAKPKSDTLARLLELLQAIPHRRYATPEELTQALNNRGYAVHVRTVQRDLQMLREHLPLEVRDDSKPHGWGWKNSPADGMAGMGVSEALMVTLVERHLKSALPASMLETFRPTFDRARRRLDRLGQRSGVAQWAEKVTTTPTALVGQAPQASREVREAVSDALLRELQLDALYRTGPRGTAKPYLLHPLGIVLRGNALYLVATKGMRTPAAFYALHRFESATVRLQPVAHDSGDTLDAALKRSKGQFGVPSNGQCVLTLHLACDSTLADYAAESPLADDQVLTRRADSRFDLRVSLPDSWELRWWLLSRSPEVEVVAPRALRREIATALRAAAARYVDA